MTSLRNLPEIQKRMNGHVKSRRVGQWMELTTTLLSLMLLTAADSGRTTAAASVSSVRADQCGTSLLQTFKITRVALRESTNLIKVYKASQGEMSEHYCKATVNIDIPDPDISGLEPSDEVAAVYTRLQAFLSHLRRVQEQQSDLQLPTNPLLTELSDGAARCYNLAQVVGGLYRQLFPNLPVPEPGPTAPPPPMNVFQQKVYGCVLLKTYRDFLSNVAREMKALRSVCRRRTPRITVLL